MNRESGRENGLCRNVGDAQGATVIAPQSSIGATRRYPNPASAREEGKGARHEKREKINREDEREEQREGWEGKQRGQEEREVMITDNEYEEKGNNDEREEMSSDDD